MNCCTMVHSMDCCTMVHSMGHVFSMVCTMQHTITVNHGWVYGMSKENGTPLYRCPIYTKEIPNTDHEPHTYPSHKNVQLQKSSIPQSVEVLRCVLSQIKRLREKVLCTWYVILLVSYRGWNVCFFLVYLADGKTKNNLQVPCVLYTYVYETAVWSKAAFSNV